MKVGTLKVANLPRSSLRLSYLRAPKLATDGEALVSCLETKTKDTLWEARPKNVFY